MKNNLNITHPKIAAQWHPTKNGNLNSTNIVAGSHKKVWWKCDIADDHEWEAQVRTRLLLNKCPYCSNRKVVTSNSLATTHPDIALQWHPTKNGELTPFDVTFGSEKKVWWQCNIASDHEWQSTIKNRAKGRGCSCCSGRKIVVSNCLHITHPELSKEWHPTKNKNLTPFDVGRGQSKKVWWQCKKSHQWNAKISDRAKSNGTGCPYCSESHGEKKIRLFLENNNINYESQKKFDECGNKKPFPFDFYLLDYNTLIEYDGIQHFKPVEWFGGISKFKKIKERDEVKNEFTKTKRIPLLRITYQEYEKIEQIIDEFISSKIKGGTNP